MPARRSLHRARTALAIVTVAAAVAGTARAADVADPVLNKIGSQLRELHAASATGREATAAGVRAIPLRASRGGAVIAVEVETAGSAAADRAELEAAGARVTGTSGSRADVQVAVRDLVRLARLPRVLAVRRPWPHVPLALSQGVALTHANAMHQAGFNGSGIKIGIFDDFQGYRDKLGNELPPAGQVVFQSFRSDHGDGDSNHGVAVAEIVADMAPGAQLYLVTANDFSGFVDAVEYLLDQHVQVINFSVGYGLAGDGKGGGPFDLAAQAAAENNALFVAAAGNSARNHWGGRFTDADSNHFHEFATGVDRLGFNIPDAREIQVQLRWDDWAPDVLDPRPTTDYDLCLYDAAGVEVACSSDAQNGAPGQAPLELLSYQAPAPGRYSIGVKKVHGADLPLDVLLPSDNDSINFGNLAVPAGSISVPADSPFALAVGATSLDDRLEGFSSRGPTGDNRIKPDLTAPDGVATSVEAEFFGTSASSPHVAGAAALLFQQSPGMSVGQAMDRLRGNVVTVLADTTPGADNNFGYGRLCADFVHGCPAPTPVPTPTPVRPPPSGGGGGGGCRLVRPEDPAARIELLVMMAVVVLYGAWLGRRR